MFDWIGIGSSVSEVVDFLEYTCIFVSIRKWSFPSEDEEFKRVLQDVLLNKGVISLYNDLEMPVFPDMVSQTI